MGGPPKENCVAVTRTRKEVRQVKTVGFYCMGVVYMPFTSGGRKLDCICIMYLLNGLFKTEVVWWTNSKLDMQLTVGRVAVTMWWFILIKDKRKFATSRPCKSITCINTRKILHVLKAIEVILHPWRNKSGGQVIPYWNHNHNYSFLDNNTIRTCSGSN